jgi:hypothetical protein
MLDAEMAAHLRALGYQNPVATQALQGRQASCLIVCDLGTSTRAVVKRFFDRAGNVHARADGEYAALQRLNAACRGLQGVDCPRPIDRLPRHLGAGYMMSVAEGIPLWDHIERGSSGIAEQIAERLITALTCYYRVSPEPYGDFDPSNVLVGSQGGVVLLDPSCPSESHRAVERRLEQEFAHLPHPLHMLCIDVGYWLYSTTALSLRLSITSPQRARRMWRFTTQLLRAADDAALPVPCGSFCMRAAQAHARRPGRGRIRRRTVGCLTLLLLELRGLGTRQELGHA